MWRRAERSFLLIDVTSVVIAFGVPDTLVGHLSIGQPLEVNTSALPDEHFVGVVHKIATMADPTTRIYSVEVRVDQPHGLKPGMAANVQLRHELRAYLLPLTSVAAGGPDGSTVVYRIVEENGRSLARSVPVILDGILDNRVAVDLGGRSRLALGDRFVVTGVHRIHDGEFVQIVR